VSADVRQRPPTSASVQGFRANFPRPRWHL